MRTRFWSPGTRPDSNAYFRLWWIAELTRDGTSYALTDRVLAKQPLATQLFVRSFSQMRSAVEAFVDVLGDASAPEIERVARELSATLGVVVLEALDVDELRRVIATLAGTTGNAA
jgi:hypothetical protein